MKSKMLKLDAPYNVIYAGGLIGRHIATLVTWTEDDEEQTIVGDVVAGETVGPGDSREFPLNQGDYVLQITAVGSTSGKVTVSFK